MVVVMIPKKKTVCITLCLILLFPLLSGCGSVASAPQTGTVAEDAVHLTQGMPENVYEITVTNCDSRSSEEQHTLAQQIAEIFAVELDPNNVSESDYGDVAFGTTDGRTIYCTSSCHLTESYFLIAGLESEGGAKQIERISITDNTDLDQSYLLNGEEYTIGQAIDFVTELWQADLSQYCFLPEMRVERAIVYQLDDGNYYYVLLLSHIYEGVPFEQYSTMTQTSRESGGFRKSFIIVEMDAPNHIAAYSDHYPIQIVSVQPILEPLLTEEEAIERAQDVLATYSNMTILESQLCYASYRNRPEGMTDEEYNSAEFIYRPYWCFVLEWGLDSDGNYYSNDWTNYTPNVTLYVDAVTGQTYLLDSIGYSDMEVSD